MEAATIFVSELDENGDREVPYNDVTLYVTRHDTATGLSVTRPFLLKVNSLHLDGIAMSLDGGEEVMSGEGTVELQQGTRVLFIPKAYPPRLLSLLLEQQLLKHLIQILTLSYLQLIYKQSRGLCHLKIF